MISRSSLRVHALVALIVVVAASVGGCPSGTTSVGLIPGVYIGTLDCSFTCSGEHVEDASLATSFTLTDDMRIQIDGDEYSVGTIGVTTDGAQTTVTDIAATPQQILIQCQVLQPDGSNWNESIVVVWVDARTVEFTRTQTGLLLATNELCTMECAGPLAR